MDHMIIWHIKFDLPKELQCPLFLLYILGSIQFDLTLKHINLNMQLDDINFFHVIFLNPARALAA